MCVLILICEHFAFRIEHFLDDLMNHLFSTTTTKLITELCNNRYEQCSIHNEFINDVDDFIFCNIDVYIIKVFIIASPDRA